MLWQRLYHEERIYDICLLTQRKKLLAWILRGSSWNLLPLIYLSIVKNLTDNKKLTLYHLFSLATCVGVALP